MAENGIDGNVVDTKEIDTYAGVKDPKIKEFLMKKEVQHGEDFEELQKVIKTSVGYATKKEKLQKPKKKARSWRWGRN